MSERRELKPCYPSNLLVAEWHWTTLFSLWVPDLICLSISAAVCIDRYTELRVKQFDNSLGEGELIDPRLETIVMRMFDRCLADKRYKQAIGIAFETRRIDVLEIALYKAVSRGM